MRPFIGMGALLLLAIGSMAEAAPDLNREVRPILATHCFTCHGPDANTRKAKLRLDEREAALEILAPGKLVDSELIHRIMSEDPDEVMPPPSLKKQLSAVQKSVLKRWVALQLLLLRKIRQFQPKSHRYFQQRMIIKQRLLFMLFRVKESRRLRINRLADLI